MNISAAQYQKKIGWLILVTVVIKIILSSFLELGNDEVYYYTYAIQPDWNHFDHPPMVGWMIRLTSLNLHWVSTLSMRLGSILSAAIATFVIFETGTLLKNERAGYIAAVLYSLSIYTTIIAGLFVLPDSPQLLFFTLSIYLMVKMVVKPHLFKIRHWLLLGLFIGLATMSKVHGLFLWAGFGAFILFHHGKTLKDKNLYLAILISLICIIPILYWNIQNDFITYRYHSKRVMHTGISLDSFIQQVVGEFLYQNPLVYISCLIPLLQFKKLKASFLNMGNNDFLHLEALWLLMWLSMPLILIFWTLSLFNPTLPHWTGPGFIALFLMAGVYWSSYSKKIVPNLIKWAGGLITILIAGFLLLVYVFPKQLGSKDQANLGEYNPINDVTGWRYFSAQFETLVQKDISEGKMKQGAPILTHKWFPGGHILFYTAQPLHMPVIGVGALEDLHKFAWLNQTQAGLEIGQNAYTIVPSNLPANPEALYGAYFEKVELAATIPIVSKGVVLRDFYVYRLIKCKLIPIHILARK